MAVTTNFQMTLLEVGQKEKEATINTNLQTIDQKAIRYLGELATDPSAGPVAGCTYFNSSTNKLKVIKTTGTWVNVA